MKKILMLTITITVLFVSVASAGVFGKVGALISESAITVAVTALLSILGTFGVGYGLWGKVAWKLYAAIKKLLAAVDPDGEEGRKISANEMEEFVDCVKDLIPAFTKAYSATVKKR